MHMALALSVSAFHIVLARRISKGALATCVQGHFPAIANAARERRARCLYMRGVDYLQVSGFPAV